MRRSWLLVCVFGMFLSVGQALGQIVPLVEWQWDDKSPSLEKTGKQIGGKDVYQLKASGILIFADDKGTVMATSASSRCSSATRAFQTGSPLFPTRSSR